MLNPELLVPAGDLDKLRFAIAFGADAVYLGVPYFSLRARENGFKGLATVAEAVAYAQAHGRKAYVTANILAHNSKVDAFLSHVKDLLSLCHPDAWIMADPGLIMLMREHFPAESIHVSVQSNVMNHATARFWHGIGARRIILSREISIPEMATIRDKCPGLELESFVHGAICIAHSGRCLISNYLAHRDSNQGACTNSCRWQYKLTEDRQFHLEETQRRGIPFPIEEDEHGTYLMNAKDLCAIRTLGELRAAGIDSFKVEGRSKTTYYVAMITRAYRRAIDDLIAGRPFDEKHVAEILTTSTRGFSEGFLHGDPGSGGLQYDNSNSEYNTARFSGIVRGYDPLKKLLILEPRNPIRVGRSYELCLPLSNEEVLVRELFDDQGYPVPEIHGGLRYCSISFDHDPGMFALLREKIA